MAIFLGIHKLNPGMSEDDVANGYESYKKAAQAAGLRPIGAVVSMEKGFAHCQTEADSTDQVRQAHSSVSVPLEDVVEVKVLS